MSREMKNSGIDWIGEIPKNWEVIKTKHAFKSEKNIVKENAKKYDRLSLTMNGVIKRDKEDSHGLQPEHFETYQIVYKNELIFKLIDLENISTSRVGYSNYTGIVSPVYIRLINPDETKYGYYYFYNMWYQHIFNFLGSGVRSSLTTNNLLNVPYLKIPFNEKEKIIKILEKRFKKIRIIISETEESIEELKKYKQSLITEAVTKGLDSNIEMKDSGVEWIGNIPKHWKFIKGKYIYKKLQRPIRCDEIVTAFRDGQVMQRSKRRTEGFTNSLKEIGYQGVEKGDLVIHSMDAFAGAIGISQDNGKCSPVCIVLNSFNSNIYNPYFSYLMRVYAYLGYIESMAKGIRVRSSDFKYHTFANTFLLIPKLQEQKQIVQYLDDKITTINRLIEDKTKVIEELNNYKKSLIYEYVTGKKEV